MFLHTILYMIILLMTFLHVYQDMCFRLADSRTVTFLLVSSRASPFSGFSLHVHELHALRYGWSAVAPQRRRVLPHIHGFHALRYGLTG